MTWVDEILESKIDVKQFGGRPGMSTTDALVEIVHNCYKTTDALGTYDCKSNFPRLCESF